MLKMTGVIIRSVKGNSRNPWNKQGDRCIPLLGGMARGATSRLWSVRIRQSELLKSPITAKSSKGADMALGKASLQKIGEL